MGDAVDHPDHYGGEANPYEATPKRVLTEKQRQRQAERSAAWYRRNHESQIERMRWNNTKRKYGVTKERYYEMLVEQGGACAICGSDDPGRKNGYFAIDHCHDTLVVRGLVCHPCNVGVGMLKSDPDVMRVAADYVERSRACLTTK